MEKKKILSIDDSSTIRKIVSMVGSVLNFETLEAENGKVALEVIEENYEEICLILLDWNMPEMNGLEVLEEIQKHKKWKNIPVMMVTTEGERKKVVEAIKHGAKNYLTKPFSQEDLITKIIECIHSEL